VRDVEAIENVRFLDDPDEMVVIATFAKDEEAAAPGAAGETAEPEVIEKGKKEEGEE
jgi:hypothetical protein